MTVVWTMAHAGSPMALAISGAGPLWTVTRSRRGVNNHESDRRIVSSMGDGVLQSDHRRRILGVETDDDVPEPAGLGLCCALRCRRGHDAILQSSSPAPTDADDD